MHNSEAIARAVALLADQPETKDLELFNTLVGQGIEREVAARLVEFIPVVFGRELLRPLGPNLHANFQRGQFEKPLTAEPVYAEILTYFRSEKARLTKEQLVAIAARSAEFDAANQLLNQGSNLRNVVFTPVVLQWGEGGPE